MCTHSTHTKLNQDKVHKNSNTNNAVNLKKNSLTAPQVKQKYAI